MSPEPPRLPPTADVVERLHELLAMRYPDASLDILTLDDVRKRYRLTGLGTPAMRAIEQAQRVVRQAGDFRQTGLCEFHIGLIYLHYYDYHGAAQQFREARRQWSFADALSSICLAYLAEGLALQLALHHEAALVCYGKGAQWLQRADMGLEKGAERPLLSALQVDLADARLALRQWLHQAWPERPSGGHVALLDEPPLPDELAGEPELRLLLPDEPAGRAFAPVPSLSPIPFGEQYAWYQVMTRDPARPQAIPPNAMVLVNAQPHPDLYRPGELILIGSQADGPADSVPVIPYNRSLDGAFAFLYLIFLQEQAILNAGAPFVREAGGVGFHFPDEVGQATDVLGLVVGHWLSRRPARR